MPRAASFRNKVKEDMGVVGVASRQAVMVSTKASLFTMAILPLKGQKLTPEGQKYLTFRYKAQIYIHYINIDIVFSIKFSGPGRQIQEKRKKTVKSLFPGEIKKNSLRNIALGYFHRDKLTNSVYVLEVWRGEEMGKVMNNSWFVWFGPLNNC